MLGKVRNILPVCHCRQSVHARATTGQIEKSLCCEGRSVEHKCHCPGEFFWFWGCLLMHSLKFLLLVLFHFPSHLLCLYILHMQSHLIYIMHYFSVTSITCICDSFSNKYVALLFTIYQYSLIPIYLLLAIEFI